MFHGRPFFRFPWGSKSGLTRGAIDWLPKCVPSPSPAFLKNVYPNWLLFGPFPQVMVANNDWPSDAEDSPRTGVDESLHFLIGNRSLSRGVVLASLLYMY